MKYSTVVKSNGKYVFVSPDGYFSTITSKFKFKLLNKKRYTHIDLDKISDGMYFLCKSNLVKLRDYDINIMPAIYCKSDIIEMESFPITIDSYTSMRCHDIIYRNFIKKY